jgi:hypothetical protein
MSDLVYRKLRGSVAITVDGPDGPQKHYIVVIEGDTIDPENGTVTQKRPQGTQTHTLADGELDRLDRVGSLSQPGVLTASEAPREALKEKPATSVKAAAFDKDAFLTGMASASNKDLAAGIAKVGVAKILEQVGGDVDLAKRVLKAERARGEEPRSSLLTALDKVIAGGAS